MLGPTFRCGGEASTTTWSIIILQFTYSFKMALRGRHVSLFKASVGVLLGANSTGGVWQLLVDEVRLWRVQNFAS